MTNYIVAEAIKTGIGTTAGDLTNTNIGAFGISDGDIATVTTSDGGVYTYKWDANSTLTEDLPRVVKDYYTATGRWVLLGKNNGRLHNLIPNSDFKVLLSRKYVISNSPAIFITSVSNGIVTTGTAHPFTVGQLVCLGIDPADDAYPAGAGIWLDCTPDSTIQENIVMFEITSVIDSTHFTVDDSSFTDYIVATAHKFRQILRYGSDFYQCINDVASSPDPPDTNYSKLHGGLAVYSVYVSSTSYGSKYRQAGLMATGSNDGTVDSSCNVGRIQAFPGKIVGRSGIILTAATVLGLSFNFVAQNLVLGNQEISKFVGKRLSLGAYVQGVGAYLELWTNTGISVKSVPNSSIDVTWHEITATIPADVAEFAAGVHSDSSALNGLFYISQPILAETDYIGEGNYVPGVGELPFRSDIPLKTFSWIKTFSTLLNFALHIPRETFYAIAPGFTSFSYYGSVSRDTTAGVPAIDFFTGGGNHLPAYPRNDVGGAMEGTIGTLGNVANDKMTYAIALNGVGSVTMYGTVCSVSYQ